jgi:Skp family chaperone for outer membrane proteins
MKYLARTILAVMALILVGSAPAAAQQTGNIVFLDSERLRREAPDLQAARERMQTEMQTLNAQADSALAPLQAEFQAMAQEYQQQQGTMAADRRQEREQELAAKQRELQQAGQQWEQRAAQKQSEILAPALERINEVIEQIRSEWWPRIRPWTSPRRCWPD